MVREYEARRNFLVERIHILPHYSCASPQGAFYLFLNGTVAEYAFEDMLSKFERDEAEKTQE